jgi:hypothetical protein
MGWRSMANFKRPEWIPYLMGLQYYDSVDIEYHEHNAANVLDVILLRADMRVTREGDFSNRYLDIDLGIECEAWYTDDIRSIELVSSQASIDSTINPSDFYYRVLTSQNRQYMSHGPESRSRTELLRMELKRNVRSELTDTPEDTWRGQAGDIHHLSFYSGMELGYETWMLYRLDFRNPDKTTWDFIKRSTYAQGQTGNITPESPDEIRIVPPKMIGQDNRD